MSEPKRVLFIDDDAALGRMFVNLLSHSGYEARSCETGALGLKEAGEFAPHLILLDIGLT